MVSWRQDGEPAGRRPGGLGWPVQTTPPTNLLHGGDAQQLNIISGITDNWSQFLVGFFRPVRQHPPDDGRLSEWATGWGGDDDGWATGWGGVSALKVNVDTRRSFAQHGGVQRSRRRRRI